MITKKLWVYMNWIEDRLDKPSVSLLAKAQGMASENDMELSVILAGQNCQKAAQSLVSKSIQNIYIADFSGLNPCEYMRIADILTPFIKDEQPDIILFPTTDTASLIASTIGQRLHTGVTVHCVDAKIQDGILIGSVPSFGGQMMGEIYCPEKRPQIATVRADESEVREGGNGTIIPITAPASSTDKLTLISVEKESQNGIALSDAELVICGGAGIQDSEGWELIKELAAKMNAAPCCTRDAIDMNSGASEKEMVGVSGLSIAPKVYLGFGVSGSAYHICGMKESKLVLNVNHDSKNPFFKSSDYGYVGDAKEVIKELLKQL